MRRREQVIRALCLMAVLLMLAIVPASAQSSYEALASQDYDAMQQAIGELALSGDARAASVIGALQAGTLYARDSDHALFIRAPDGGFVAVESGKPDSSITEDDVSRLRVNNAVRRAIDAALGALRLQSPDLATRMAAAEAVFVSHDAAALPALERALAHEPDGKVARAMREARAAIILTDPSASDGDQLAAIAVIRARGDQAAGSLLASVAAHPGTVGQAAAVAQVQIDRILQLWSLLEDIVYGLSLGSVLLLAAAGLAITFGVMGVINMAHGEMVMLGAYTTFVVQQAIDARLPAFAGASLVIAVPLAFLVTGAIGVLVERTLIRFLYGRPLETLLATWGLSLVLQQAVRSIFGPDNRAVATPGWMSGALQLGGLKITDNRLAIVVFAALVLAALMAALRYTALGLQMRAVTQNRRMAAAMGIRTPWVDALTFGLGSGVAGMAGVALSQIDNVSPNLGQSYIIDSFMVVVFGGVGNLWGTAVGALTLGIINKFLEPLAGAVLSKIFVLVMLIVFIQRRPRGLFPLKGRAVEA
jgi:urea transport system permease protein